jgi:probable FeS assembly SUF system protein SufT
MQTANSVNLKRDCEAIQIPVGNPVTLHAGTPVDIAQTLGGTYTVYTMGGLFRIDGKDADALGLEPGQTASPTSAPAPSAGQQTTEQLVWDTLKTCFDPEIPVNIVDLGLVYDMGLEPLATGGQKVFVKMTLTAPGCGMGTVIARDAQQKLLGLPGIQDASVDIVWDPPWHQSMITAQGRRILGLE